MTITHSSFHKEMEDILLEIRQLSNNIFVEKYVEVPTIEYIRLKVLNLFLQFSAVPAPIRKSYCVTAGIIQMGLDLHESVTNRKESKEWANRNRQLSILAGDYYSSQFYSLLAKNHLIDGVRKLSKGIRNINIAKMKIYTRNNGRGFADLNEILELIKIREGNLYIQFIDEVSSKAQQQKWQEIIEYTILLDTLKKENHNSQVENTSPAYILADYYSNKEEKNDVYTSRDSLYIKYGIDKKVKDITNDIFERINYKIDSIEDIGVRAELLSIIEQLFNAFPLQSTVEKA